MTGMQASDGKQGAPLPRGPGAQTDRRRGAWLAATTAMLGVFACSALSSPFDRARDNGPDASEALQRSLAMVHAWMEHRDTGTGLIPRNLRQPQWVVKDSAADNFPFWVLTAWYTDRSLYYGPMHDILQAEIRLTNRVDRLPDDYDFRSRTFVSPELNLDRIIFGSTEYVKDGLLMLTEALGPHTLWTKRMIAIVDDTWKHAQVETPFGRIPSDNVEVNGELLQTLSRLYFQTGDGKYLEWAIRLGDYYLLDSPARSRLRDHFGPVRTLRGGSLRPAGEKASVPALHPPDFGFRAGARRERARHHV
jgi:hypothetical protein